MTIQSILLLTLSTMVLGACTTADLTVENNTNTETVAPSEITLETNSQVEVSADAQIDAQPAISADDSFSTIETEIQGTVILEEDFSDL